MAATKVLVLGHRGMLGHVVHRYLAENGFEVLTTDERFTGGPEDKLITKVKSSDADWIINTIGKLDPNRIPALDLLLVNAQLPVHLKSFLRPSQRLIHASTDGVFSGKTGNYAVDTERDATDPYGFSKTLGEVIAEHDRAFVIRTSIIGPSPERNTGLLSWFLSQTNPVKGFTNHLWNGITTLEWAKLCAEIIAAPSAFPSILQPACAMPVSKYELLQTIADTWSHKIPISPAEHSTPLNRTLLPTHKRPLIRQQLEELRDWSQKEDLRTNL
jgi:dTDP-4-dehydrorhamnose reductase